MANAISDEISTDVRALITQITNRQVGSDQFNNLEKGIISKLKKSDTMYFLNTKDMEKEICSMADKFRFHGFFEHADYLKMLHDKYIDKNLSEPDLTPRLNVLKFLLCMSEKPTENFWKHPEQFDFIRAIGDGNEVVDWGAYLNEGIEKWSSVQDDSSSKSTDSCEENVDETTVNCDKSNSRIIINELQNIEVYDFQSVRKKLLESIQTGWYNGEAICVKPPSDWFDANAGILWEQHLIKQTGYLIPIEPLTVISEYNVIREILWQCWGVHNSTVFELNSNKLIPRTNVTISSVFATTFERFMGVFVSYIEVLDDLRQFDRVLEGPNICETYKSYGCALKKITKPVFDSLVEIEKRVREQETTMTLLMLADEFRKLFEPVLVLKKVHEEVILENFQNVASHECALKLITNLRKSLYFSLNKLERDIRLTLYLGSLYYYLIMVHAWFVKNDLFDHTHEFIIVKNNDDFVLQDNIENFCKEDGVIKMISDQVLQIGRNIHLLRLLGKFDVFSKDSETVYQEFLRMVLHEISKYCDCQISDDIIEEEEPKLQKIESTFDISQMGDWTNYVDLSDGLLAKAFEDFSYEKVEIKKTETLYDKICKTTTSLIPFHNIPEKVFAQILKERFTVSGLMVKNLLIENYSLDKQFEFLNHVFLFWNDAISSFYRRLFQKMNIANSNWGNSVWLTSHLQDIIMDTYPNFYEDCTVQVKDEWKECRDSLEACTLINVQYEIKWPLNIFITDKHVGMYKEIFQFILKLKWALYTINHLFFTDLEPKNRTQKVRASQQTIKRLKYLRFNMINILNTTQHYLFGYVFATHRIRFNIDFEKSNDLKSLITSHEVYVKSVHGAVAEIGDKKEGKGYGFNTLLKCVKMLKVMWNQVEYATMENLDHCHKIYNNSFGVVNEIVSPVFVFDY